MAAATIVSPELATAVRGPPLTGVFGKKIRLVDGNELVADEEYLRESILRPQAKVVEGYKPLMPTFEGQIDEDGLAALVAYLKASLATEPKAAANK